VSDPRLLGVPAGITAGHRRKFFSSRLPGRVRTRHAEADATLRSSSSD